VPGACRSRRKARSRRERAGRPSVPGYGDRATSPGTEKASRPNILRSAAHPPTRVYPDPGRSTGRRLDVEDGTAGRWLDVNSAAEELGVSTDAVRKRISRGTLRSDRKDGTVRVWLDDGGTQAGREVEVDSGALVEVLREQAEYLRGQLAEEREARRRADTIIAQLTQANAALAARVPELEAPPEVADAPETVEEPSDREEPRSPGSAAGGVQEDAHRPWWRRVFGR
jgi:hypothetical protein